eukprot:21173-Eustigmatos_ZCMA.PRE.1
MQAVVGLSMGVDGQAHSGRAVGETAQEVNGEAFIGQIDGDGGGWDHGGGGADAGSQCSRDTYHHELSA